MKKKRILLVKKFTIQIEPIVVDYSPYELPDFVEIDMKIFKAVFIEGSKCIDTC